LRRIARVATAVAVFLVAIPLVWYGLYPEPYDPKNIGFVLWKHGLNPYENLGDALAAIRHGDLIDESVGHTEADLRVRWGYLTTPHQRGGTLEDCYNNTPSIKAKEKALFLRDSWYLATFTLGKVDDVVHMKPC
jgi:hypothetical protein